MRDYNDPIYKRFRNEVRNRDGRKCRWPGCGCKKKLNVHHILPWSKFPGLRYAIANGITLCKKHHAVVKGKELDYAQTFIRIIRDD